LLLNWDPEDDMQAGDGCYVRTDVSPNGPIIVFDSEVFPQGGQIGMEA
jgi:hypothetical protein